MITPINGSDTAESDLLDHCGAMSMKMTKYPFLWPVTKLRPEAGEAWFSAVGYWTIIMLFSSNVPLNISAKYGFPAIPTPIE